MNRTSYSFSLIAVAMLATPAGAQAPNREDATVDSATRALNEIMAAPESKIPGSMLADAQGLAIIPGMVKGGFVVGVRHGRGIVAVRDENGNWRPPTFITMTGGSVGWQAGIQATDVILVFKTQRSVQGLMTGKFTIGADAAAAAGPVGRQAAAATDGQLKAEIYSYSRSRGLFAGVAVDGSVLQVDAAANQAYYQGGGLTPDGQPAALPASSVRLLQTIATYTGGPAAAEAAPQVIAEATSPMPAGPAPLTGGAADGPATQQDLVRASAALQAILDDQWKQFLALPRELYDPRTPVSIEAVNAAVSRFEAVAQNPAYAALAQRPEFQTMQRLLKAYQAGLAPAAQPALTLPPPPSGVGAAPVPTPRY